MLIQWYPGHMVKARREISESMKLVDALCEITDARIPLSSRNPDLDGFAGNKPRLIILNRVDQADPIETKKWKAYFQTSGYAVIETDCKSGRGVEQLQPAAKALLSDTINANKEKGKAGKPVRLIITGIPNVGKSSLINRAAKRKAAQTSDRPGVTRGKQWINLGTGIELLDTPGVLWPKFNDSTVAENLAFTGAIRDEVMDIETLGAKLMQRLCRDYPQSIRDRYKIDIDYTAQDSGSIKDSRGTEVSGSTAGSGSIKDSRGTEVSGSTAGSNTEGNFNTDDTEDSSTAEDAYGFKLLEAAARKRGFLIPGGECDTLRMATVLLDEFRGGLLGRITLERYNEPGH